MDKIYELRQEARECERIADLEREQAKIDYLIAKEEQRRQDIARRLGIEVRRLESMRRT